MNGRKYDMAIVGGGLAGGLIALALRRQRPELDVLLLEAGTTIGGNHRWSWFASDLSEEAAGLLEPFRKEGWSDGYEVRFPAFRRHLATSYHSLASTEFDAGLRRMLPAGTIHTGTQAISLDASGVTLADGGRIAARTVIDCRGHAPSTHLTGGWQVFLGRHLRTTLPHKLSRPVIMDSRVDQHGSCRFVYVLPLGARELFVEDTYYADSPHLDRRALSSRIDAYCSEHGWDGEILGSETGVLPVITGGNFAAFQARLRLPGVAVAGARGGFVHPLTSYTLPFAVDAALAIAAEADLPGQQLAALLEDRARRHWRATRFYRRLGRMMFGAAAPEQRYRVFEHFYRMPPGVIERFYAARSTTMDRARILCGKPPVPLSRAIGALLRSGPPMAEKVAA
jgi:lycopene beta-cyclase